MGRIPKAKPTEKNIKGLKYFKQLMPLLERLHGVGAARDRAGNRKLHFDHYCAFLLLFLFNPIVTSLRGIQQASELKKVQKKLGCPRTSLGSLSEATEVFDPEPLRQIAGELAGQLQPLSNNRQFPEVKHLITAVDGSVVSTLSNVVQAGYLKSPTDGSSKSAYRLHTHFDIERGVPMRIDVTGGCNSGDGDEREVLKKALEIFFRFLKHILGCRHLISTDRVGVEIQAYCAIIACLLMVLWTGKKPTKRTYEMICFYFIGWADEEELLAHFEKLKDQTN